MQPLDYHQPKGKVSVPSMAFAFVTCVVGLAGNVLGMLAASTLRHVPPGTPIRPMGLAVVLFYIAFGTAFCGVSIGIVALASGWRRFVIWLVVAIGVVLSLMPLFTSRWVLFWIVARRGLVLEG